jgi:hypothetical protein
MRALLARAAAPQGAVQAAVAVAGTLILLAQALAAPVSAGSIPIVDSTEAFPFLRSVDNPGEPIRWDSGTLIQMLSSCKLVRVTRRGVRCIAARHTLMRNWEAQFELAGPTAGGGGGSADSCLPHSHALCATRTGDRFFPSDQVFVGEVAVAQCDNGQGRVLLADRHDHDDARWPAALHAGAGTAPAHSDVSLCDILDRNLDVVYDPVNNRLFTADLKDTAWLYFVISILILVVVVMTAETVSQRDRSSITHNIVAWVLLAVCSLLMLVRVDGRMHPFVSEEDQTFTMISSVYVLASTLFWIATSQYKRFCVEGGASTGTASTDTGTAPGTPQSTSTTSNTTAAAAAATTTTTATTATTASPNTQRDGINAMIGSIHLATTVLYGTPDNTYVAAFFFVFLFRCMQKLHDAHAHPRDWSVCANSMLLIDFTYTALVFTFGVLPHYDHDDETVLYAAAQYIVCDAVAANCVMSTSAALTRAATAHDAGDKKARANNNTSVPPTAQTNAPDMNAPNPLFMAATE